MPYNTAISIASDGAKIFVATKESFYIRDLSGDELEPFSKVNGMSDVGLTYIGYDTVTSTVILAYTNGNIDLYKDHKFSNLPYLKLKTVTGTKRINQIYTHRGTAYLSTDIGIIAINLEKKEVKETYEFVRNSESIAVRSVTIVGDMIYAATNSGLYRINKNTPNIQSFNRWQAIDNTRKFISIASIGNMILTTGEDSVYAIESDNLRFVYKSDTTARHLDPGINGIWLSETYSNTFNGKMKKFNTNYQIVDSFNTPGFTAQVIEIGDAENSVYVADEFSGLKLRAQKSNEPYNTVLPDGPSSATVFDLYAYNNELLVAHGGRLESWAAAGYTSGFSHLANDKWKQYSTYGYLPFAANGIVDITQVHKDGRGNIYAGSHQSGLFILKGDGSYELYKNGSVLDENQTAGGNYSVGGMAMDRNGNLWLTMYAGANELAMKTIEGNWMKYRVFASRPIPNAAGELIIDDLGQKWYAAPRGGGLIVYNDNNTPEDIDDDRYAQLVSGKGVGGLPNNEVHSLAIDKSGAIWVGTGNGIGIINCPGQVLDRECEAELRVVQYDKFAGNLFEKEVVRAIAVDGGNRKWIGTTNGVWLLSPDGDKILTRFTADNSPLPTNNIQSIAIDPITGDVYFGTDKGLVSYRGTSTEGGETNSGVVTFPNPVPSGYQGTIAIKGLAENADVRITDVSGQLVYRTKAFGGQAVWNGMDYTGRKPQSGVYMVFITNNDGTQTHVGKLVFLQ
jgi:ligand-binding sensor domain-containing protein